jgi:hypothetical protein
VQLLQPLLQQLRQRRAGYSRLLGLRFTQLGQPRLWLLPGRLPRNVRRAWSDAEKRLLRLLRSRGAQLLLQLGRSQL